MLLEVLLKGVLHVPRCGVALARLRRRQVLHGLVVLLLHQLAVARLSRHPLDYVDLRRRHLLRLALVGVGLEEAVLEALLLEQQVDAPEALGALHVLQVLPVDAQLVPLLAL